MTDTIPLLQDKRTYKASAAIGQLRRKLGKLTIPAVLRDTPVWAAANQEAGIESRDPRHHCKQTWQTENQIHPFITMFLSGTKTSR